MHSATPTTPAPEPVTAIAQIPLCSCGCTEPHVFAVRETVDDRRVRLWTDGTVSHACAGDPYVRGLSGPSALRSRYARMVRINAVRLVADSIGMFDVAEIATLVHAAESTFAHSYSSEADRSNHARLIASMRLSGRKHARNG